MKTVVLLVVSLIVVFIMAVAAFTALWLGQAYLFGPNVGLSQRWEWPIGGASFLFWVATTTLVLNFIWRKA